ncbi:MAG: hypothetical protein IT323_00385, partial [Anaerolineae bacterium]|nr:hypothetical protein [Anaerolineae bacterium]
MTTSRPRRSKATATDAAKPNEADNLALAPRKLDPDPEKTFVLSPDADIVTGQRLNRVGSRRHIYLALVAVVIAALAALYAAHQMDAAQRRTEDYVRRAQSTQATITARRLVDGGRDLYDRYFITYAFTAPGPDGAPAQFQREIGVDKETYERYVEGTLVLVKYLPDDPATSTLVHLELAPVDLDLLRLLLAGPAVLAGLILLWAAWLSLRYSRYQRRGRVIQGEVVTAAGGEIGNRYTITLRYSFHSPTGKTLTGHASQVREDLKKTPLPKPGDPVGVLYVSDSLYRLL